MKPYTNRAHMTLIEMLIAIVVGSIVVLGAHASFVYFFSQVGKGEEQAEAQRDADLAAYWIELTVRLGNWAYLDKNKDNSLVVESFETSTQWDKRRIYAQGKRLMVDTDGDAEEIVDNLKSLHFYPGVGRVEYELEIQYGGNTYTLSSSKALRNAEYHGLWHFSDIPDDVAYDSSSYNNNAAVYGASLTAGALGNGLQFDGGDDYLSIPDNDGLDSGQKVAFGAWVDGSGTIISRNVDGSASGFFTVYIESNRIYYAFDPAGAFSSGNLPAPQGPGNWREVLVQHDGTTGRIHFYCDGKRVGKVNGAGAMTAVTSGDAHIGCSEDAMGFTRFWNGALDEVRFVSF